MANAVEQRMKELGIQLPPAAAAASNYVGYVVSGSMVFVSGQLPLQEGKPTAIGKLGREVSLEEGQKAARICALNVLAQLREACNGDLGRVKRCVRLGGFVNSAPEFTDQPKVVNGASDLMAEVFADAGRHTRASVGVASLPSNVAVEVEGLFELR